LKRAISHAGGADWGERIEYDSGHTGSVKTAVSVPDDLFRLAEVAARRLRVSRSQLYATAISEFLNRQQGGAVTERLNEVYSHRPAKVDSALHRAQLRSLE
jgi:metal-responsive CopG/Arc/MetJ family transcriptional regulator